ncbi:LysR family transcriptional regulator [Pseudoalteromonas sp. A757]|uniref:LysR family transcriptional regulator n=1 Tax=Pseudoalteromonas sp. A757 TaxID=2250709 RepID=UPI000FFE9E60|nr:LysR family transcriptional regulator [Pseudoalteromonas sp. A757]RXE89521.1 LysR family transcriptional regulator [Pseudoalteromonas sp. A757]
MAKLDINLLVIFDAIMAEQSVTAAADRLALTQPSVSKALSRMRYVWKDPLFVRDGRGIKPTPRAEILWREVRPAIQTLIEATSEQQFAPTRSERTFRIALTDGMTRILWLPLRQRIEQQAPKINLHAMPFRGNGESLLLDARVDLVVDYYENQNRKIIRQHLFDNHFVCLMRPEHPLAQSALSLKLFSNSDHLMVSLSGDTSSVVCSALAKHHLQRRIAVTVNSFSAAIDLIKQTDLLCVLPYLVAHSEIATGSLVSQPLPLNVSPAPISMAYHIRTEADPGVHWLRQQIMEITAAIQSSSDQVP